MGTRFSHPINSRYAFIAIAFLICTPATLGYMSLEGQSSSVTTLTFDGAPAGVVFIADPHLKAETMDHTRQMIDEINALHPSVVLIGGDFVYGEDPDLSLQQVWQEVDAPVYAVLGNHDYRSGIDAFSGLQRAAAVRETTRKVAGYDLSVLRDGTADVAFADSVEAELEKSGVTVLRNEYVTLDVNGTSLRIVGVDDGWAGMADPPAVPEDDDAFTIYMIHEPECRADWDADLILAGHTHGGQVMLPGIKDLNDRGVIELSGLVQKGVAPVYISRGVGTSNLRTDLRLNAPPEIVMIGPTMTI
jgi:predicted MPP superfamily phosphohydrolase